MSDDPIDGFDSNGVPPEFMRRNAIVEIDTGTGPRGKIILFAPVFAESDLPIGVPFQATITVQAVAEGPAATCALMMGWRQAQLAEIEASLKPTGAPH